VLAVIDFDTAPKDTEVEQLVSQRSQARQTRDFARAAALREQLCAMGIRLIDSPTGTRWERI